MHLIQRRPYIALTGLAVLALLVRLALVLTHDGFLGVDGGAYLLNRNYVLGDEPTGAGFPRPVLAPGWLLVPFTAVLGDDYGFKVWSAVAAITPILAVYLLANRWLTPLQSLAAAALIAVDPWQAEMIVTGALPLVAFSLLLVAIWAILSLAEDWNGGAAVILIGAIVLIPHVNQTTAGLTAIILPVSLLAIWLFSRRFHGRLWVVVMVASLLATSALPWYWDVRPNSEILHYPGPWVYLLPFGDVAWLQFAIALGVGAWAIRSNRTIAVKVSGVVVLLLGAQLAFLSTDETLINLFYRPRYLVMMFLWPLMVTAVADSKWRPEVKPALMTAVMVGLTAVYAWTFIRQTVYSDMVTPQTAEALAYLRSEEPFEGVISNAFTMALWVSALNKVHSPHPWTWQPPRAYEQDDYHVRCVLGWIPGCDAALSAGALRVGFVLVDQRFPDYNDRAPANYLAPPDQWAVTARVPWLDLVYSMETTKLWRITF